MESRIGSGVDVVVTVASWEPRFIEGIKRTLAECSFRRLLAYFIGEYGGRTEEARRTLRQVAGERTGVVLRKGSELLCAGGGLADAGEGPGSRRRH